MIALPIAEGEDIIRVLSCLRLDANMGEVYGDIFGAIVYPSLEKLSADLYTAIKHRMKSTGCYRTKNY